MKNELYHYTESGLMNVFLVDGFEHRATPAGRTLFIQDIDGLHKAIGRTLVESPYALTGAEFRFLRTELLMSQRTLAKLLGVAELTVARWEKEERPIPRASEGLLRVLYAEHIGSKGKLSELLERIADLEDEIDDQKTLKMRESPRGWKGDLVAA
jgi:DNA-binding transcriptional regulator YiaG